MSGEVDIVRIRGQIAEIHRSEIRDILKSKLDDGHKTVELLAVIAELIIDKNLDIHEKFDEISQQL